MREALGRFHGDLGGDPGAEPDADDQRVAQVELLEKIEIEVGEIVDRAHALRQLGSAEAGMGGREQPGAAAECIERRLR